MKQRLRIMVRNWFVQVAETLPAKTEKSIGEIGGKDLLLQLIDVTTMISNLLMKWGTWWVQTWGARKARKKMESALVISPEI